MPIVEAAGSGPLRQGDILTNLAFFTTGDNGPLAGDRAIPYSVVISRDCKALRADTILVAEIHPYNQAATFKEILSGQKTFDEARQILGALRDGDGSPDTCYLGPLRDGEERFAVKLDRIHCVAVPEDEGDKRLQWIESHRVLRLTPDFIRHLQVKLFASIVKQGFDDYAWWPTQDLAALALVGQSELNKLSADLSKAELALKTAELANSQSEIKGRRAAVKNGTEEVEKLQKALQPYKEELDRRRSADDDQDPRR